MCYHPRKAGDVKCFHGQLLSEENNQNTGNNGKKGNTFNQRSSKINVLRISPMASGCRAMASSELAPI
jgi:hypothetical protein